MDEKIIKYLAQIEQNTRSQNTAVLCKTRQELQGGRVTVKIRGTIYGISDIDNVRQEFSANLLVRARWKEPLFAGVNPAAEIDWDDQWNPRLELENAVSVRNFDRKYEVKYFHTDHEDRIPHICLTMNISATFKEMFELDDFPFDYQALNIWLVSEWPFNQLELVKDDEFMDHLAVSTFPESNEWKLYPQVIGEPVGQAEEINEIVGSKDQFPLYTLTCHVSRMHAFYLWNHILYMALIYLISFTTFAIDAAEPGSRLTVSMLALLCAIAFRMYTQNGLPQIAYWTALDKYNMFLMVSHFTVIIENAIIGGLAQYPESINRERLWTIDLCFLGAMFAVQLSVHMYFIAFAMSSIQKRTQFLKEETESFEDTNNLIWKKYLSYRKSLQESGSLHAPPAYPEFANLEHMKTHEVRLSVAPESPAVRKVSHKKKKYRKSNRISQSEQSDC